MGVAEPKIPGVWTKKKRFGSLSWVVGPDFTCHGQQPHPYKVIYRF